ncbi:MAG TPA: GNAT family N-acetyltransferase [Croceibacterium sp.]
MIDIQFAWNDPEDARDAATFAGAVIGREPAYISHGEIQTGLSPDGKRWADSLVELYAEDFADPGGRDMVVGRDVDGKVRGFLILGWQESDRLKYAVIEDMAVDPELRSHGIGAHLVKLAEERVRAADGVDWIFLESGLENESAHRFFEREGFDMTSHVFARRLR